MTHRERIKRNLLIFTVMIAACGITLLARIMSINLDSEYYSEFDMSVPRNVNIICSYGDIYDRNGLPLVNLRQTYLAVINPEQADRALIEPHVVDREKFDSCIDGNALFLCQVDSSEIEGITVIPVAQRYSASLCSHIIGYTGENGGVSGLELSYDDILREPKSQVTLTYSMDANGNLLEGEGVEMKWTESYNTGISTAIDRGIQLSCEKAMEDVEKGAAVVMDIHTGEICAVVSKPDFDPSHPEESLDSEDSPFVNRAFSAFSVGSIFKLVTAGAALEYGISDEYTCDCTGSIKIRRDEFGCHRFGGHGQLDMRKAMVESCNPYFICLGQEIPASFFHDFADKLGFGREMLLADSIYSAGGNLTTEKELLVPEEMANFSFGQGRLTATPLQITMLTAAIAGDGQMPSPLLVNGSTNIADGITAVAASPRFTRVMSSSTAQKLKSFMISTMYKENSCAVPEFTTGGGKTSTAQTWIFDEYGNEKLNCWFTGFFPADDPRYAVTVMIEDGISGNVTCGPVFAEIADLVKLGRYSGEELPDDLRQT